MGTISQRMWSSLRGVPIALSWKRSLMIELDAPDWWVQVPVLSGPSIRVREVEAADAAALLELFSDLRVNHYLYPPPSSLTQFEGFIEWAQRQRESGEMRVLRGGAERTAAAHRSLSASRARGGIQCRRVGVCDGAVILVDRACSRKRRRSSPNSRSRSA